MKHLSMISSSIGIAAAVAALLPGIAGAVDADTAQQALVAARAAPVVPDNTPRVRPPPLPTGSQVVQQVVGEAPDVKVRNDRAHHDRTTFKKDKTRDDTRDPPTKKPGG